MAKKAGHSSSSGIGHEKRVPLTWRHYLPVGVKFVIRFQLIPESPPLIAI